MASKLSALLLVWASLFAGQAQAQPLLVDERVPIAIIPRNPTGELASLTPTEIIQTAGELLDAHTDFSIFTPNEIRVRQALGDEPDVLVRLSALIDEETQTLPQYLIVLIYSPSFDSPTLTEVSALVLDLRVAMGMYNKVDFESEGWRDELESRLGRQAIPEQARPVEAKLLTPTPVTKEGFRSYLEQLLTEDLRPMFEASGHWHPFGGIDVHAQSGLAITVDGRVIGQTSDGPTRLRQMRAGARKVGLTRPEYYPFETEITVSPEKVETLSAPALEIIPPSIDPRRVTIYTGAAVAAIGAGFLTAALINHNNQDSSGCVSTNPDANCGLDTGIRPEAVAGIGALGAGLTWSLGALAFSEKGKWPWVVILSGAVVAGASVGLSLALSP